MKSFQSALIKLTIECFEIVNISLRASFCLKLVIDDSSCTLYKHVVMLFYIFSWGERVLKKTLRNEEGRGIKSSVTGCYIGG